MKDITYKIKCIRMHEETWKLLKEKRKKSGQSWNLFIYNLIKKHDTKTTHKTHTKQMYTLWR